jgi:hypothetical protein
MGVLTHLDAFKEPSKLKKAKKALKVGGWASHLTHYTTA